MISSNPNWWVMSCFGARRPATTFLNENLLKRGTHAPPSNVVALYTSVAWETLCREVAKLNLTPRDALGEEAFPMVAYRRIVPLARAPDERERFLAQVAAHNERIRAFREVRGRGPTGTKPGNGEAPGTPRASSGGAGNRNSLSVNGQPRDGARLSPGNAFAVGELRSPAQSTAVDEGRPRSTSGLETFWMGFPRP